MKKNKIVEIDGIEVGYNRPVPVIAEIGVNHLGDLDRAKKMVDLANEGGADFKLTLLKEDMIYQKILKQNTSLK